MYPSDDSPQATAPEFDGYMRQEVYPSDDSPQATAYAVRGTSLAEQCIRATIPRKPQRVA